MKRIPIFFTFDEGYVNQAAVAFYSLLAHAKGGVAYAMVVLHHDVSAKSQALLQSVCARFPGSELTFVDTGDFMLDEWAKGNWEGNQDQKRFTSDAVVRCFCARFFPSQDKIIYSDVDVVFADDISELWDMDLDGAYLAGVRGVNIKYHPMALSHLKPEHYEMLKDKYISGGIWVLNLAKIREDRLEDRMLEVVRDDTIVKRWNDQDVMNIACAGKVKFLPLNYIALPFLDEIMQRPDFDSFYTRDELYDSVIRPKILHYAGTKPWQVRMNWDYDWWNIADYLGLDVKRPGTTHAQDPSVPALKRAKRRYRALFIGTLAVLAIVIATFCWAIVP